ncbi:ABC transporter ATP-binding protein [Demequina mangrovi]|uniref:ABC-2 type transport system ATP-binding protein n=1 Tax=Demequina mangrovi TaxID=1043493 RepID=A0A1H7AT66_9MICO|nr:ABC transporter ATP-binding protein [Demequina mangrovi]SEJ68498.1 ABC-2 type transport system ATP-binding protein [Demequina mangrovi]
MTAIIEAQALSRRFGSVHAVDGVTFAVEEGSVTGLLGRNGAGKTTLMNLVTGQDFASGGTVRIFGEDPVENARALTRTCFIKESQGYPDAYRGRHVLAMAERFFPHYDAALAARLVADFGVPVDRMMKKMSRGQRSAVGAIVGIASRAELTLLDEPYAGLDAVARHVFYDRLLEDYAAHPRTIVLSTHLIDEAADLLDHVLVIHEGRLEIDAATEDLRGAASTLVGRAADVDAFVEGREVLGRERVAGISSATVAGLDAQDKALAASSGLEVTPVSLQQLIVRRTGGATTREEAA